MLIEELKISATLGDMVASFGGYSGFYLLDSGDFNLPRARYSFIGLKPKFSVFQEGNNLFLEERGKITKLEGNLLNFLKDHLLKNRTKRGPFPFNLGFIGYLTYDFGWLLDKFRSKKFKKRVLNLPLAKFNYYSEVIVYDHRDNRFYYVAEDKGKQLKNRLKELEKIKGNVSFSKGKANIRSSLSRERYKKAILKTKQYIESGDIYQANISQRFFLNFNHNPLSFYLKLREVSPAPFGAYLKEKDATVICNSPERFLLKKGRYIETCPIKGTRKRYNDKIKDRLAKIELKNSEKDRAEHIMIVDLERNDIGKICEIGSVKVKRMCNIESYANVHHMVSTVCGKLRKGIDIMDCIYATFPGGSITGAPKVRSMEIIDEIEPVNRGIYCGSIGYIDNSGDADFNIAIRTGIITDNKLYFYVGGGIVADSDPTLEYEETITKARAFLSVLNLMELKD